MDPYKRDAIERMLENDITNYCAEKLSIDLVQGFSDMVGEGDAIRGGNRVAGFMETHLRHEWYLPLSATKGMTWRAVLPKQLRQSKVGFLFSGGFGNGSPLPQPTGSWDISVNGRKAVSIRGVKYTTAWKSDECVFAFSANRVESAPLGMSLTLGSVLTDEGYAAFGPCLLIVPTEWVHGSSKAEITVESRSFISSPRWFQVATTPNIIDSADIYPLIEMVQAGRAEINGSGVFFGDIHTHSGQVLDDREDKGCGIGSRKENYEYARGPGNLDFYSLTDHEWQVDQQKIGGYLGLADEYNRDGRFVCLPGFEFTSLVYGHRNIYFRESGGTIVNANNRWGGPTKDPSLSTTPDELWKQLEKNGKKFLSIPHHPSAASHPFNWKTFKPEYDRLVEIYSCWGSSEYLGDTPRGVSDRFFSLMVREALNRGMRFGVIGSADGHDGHPGNAQSPMIKHHHLFHYCGSGLAAVFAPELTRESVFDALYNRACYATTGTPIRLWFEINGKMMGSVLPRLDGRERPRLKMLCSGTCGIDHLRIVKNGSVAETIPCHGEPSVSLEWEDGAFDGERSNYYYVRVVQNDRESAWSSPIWVG